MTLAGIAKASPVEKRSISGDVTYFYRESGLGACGIYNSNTDFIAAVSASYFDAFPGYAGGNPNANPLCGRTIQVDYQGRVVNVKVTDRCVGCAYGDVDLTPSAFTQLADLSVGRLHGASWNLL
ncbi:RlpA-like double-psi beta-barrel-protein domain-containing protein-containing protein [Cyathus striatus]|nr:RlpA-like double-psi beta-barrel-protein domain-containing protein-containing protein [Cyathus striatus]